MTWKYWRKDPLTMMISWSFNGRRKCPDPSIHLDRLIDWLVVRMFHFRMISPCVKFFLVIALSRLKTNNFFFFQISWIMSQNIQLLTIFGLKLAKKWLIKSLFSTRDTLSLERFMTIVVFHTKCHHSGWFSTYFYSTTYWNEIIEDWFRAIC